MEQEFGGEIQRRAFGPFESEEAARKAANSMMGWVVVPLH